MCSTPTPRCSRLHCGISLALPGDFFRYRYSKKCLSVRHFSLGFAKLLIGGDGNWNWKSVFSEKTFAHRCGDQKSVQIPINQYIWYLWLNFSSKITQNYSKIVTVRLPSLSVVFFAQFLHICKFAVQDLRRWVFFSYAVGNRILVCTGSRDDATYISKEQGRTK